MPVDDHLVAAVIDNPAALALLVPVTWRYRETSARTQMAVHNAHGLQIFVGMQVIKDKPWKPTAYLMYEGEHLRRLDVNGSHTNRTPDRERWRSRTHKHTWTEAHHDAVAYTPTDIPQVPIGVVTSDHLRDVFEGFLTECGIATRGAYDWSDPNLALDFSRRPFGEM